MSGELILVVEDEAIARENLSLVLEREGYRPMAVGTAEDALRELEREEYALVLTDLMLPGLSGIDLLERARSRNPALQVIVITGHATVHSAVTAMQKGAHSYVPKPVNLDELRLQVRKALEQRELSVEVLRLRRELSKEGVDFPLVGQSDALVRLKRRVRQVADMDCTVLIQGETGTGKELVARSIHMASSRSGERFMAINCGTFTAELMDKELFGHEKEAFTGAGKGQKGILEAAEGGTVFLDEVGELPLNMQVKLLRVLQERNFLRVGGTREIPVNIRVIAATNCDLRVAVEEGRFRQDLYYRLNVVTLRVPPLRDIRDDIPRLVGHFLQKHRTSGHYLTSVAQETLEILGSYPFPGNGRELENIVQRALALAKGESFTPDLLSAEVQGASDSRDRLQTLEELEQEHIRRVMRACGDNRTHAAKTLGIDRVSLWRKLKRYGME